MRLLRKLLLALCAVYLATLGVAEYLTVRLEVKQLERDVQADLEHLGRVLQAAARERWQDGNEAAVLGMLADATFEPSGPTVRWLPGGMTRAPGSDRIRLVMPMVVDGVEHGSIELSVSRERLRAYMHKRIVRVTQLALTLFAGSLVLVWVLGRRLVGDRLARLVQQARRIGAGELAVRMDVRGSDEIAVLGREMNTMADELMASRRSLENAEADRLQVLSQLRHADRLASIGRIASVLAHELGTPLNIVMARAKLIADHPEEASEVAKNAAIVHGQVLRMTDTIAGTLGLARQASAITRVDLCEVTREALHLLEPLVRHREVSVVLRTLDSTAPIEGRRSEIEQIVMNLVNNAFDAVERGGNIELEVATVAAPPERHWTGLCQRLSVRDDGRGIPGADVAHVFQPYFTSKKEGRGTGLGLWIVDGIVREHGGWIELESRVGTGTLFRVYLPAGSKS